MKVILTTDTHYGINGTQTRKNHERFIDEVALAIETHQCKAVIHTGDWITHRQEQLEKTFALFRSKIQIPILTVFGNHDYWNEKHKGRFRSLGWNSLLVLHDELLEKYNITHVNKKPTIIDDTLFIGIDGWYHNPNPPTNDLKYLPNLFVDGHNIHGHLSKKAYNDLNNILDTIDTYEVKKKVFLTHFPPFADNEEDLLYSGNPKFLEYIKEKFDVLCYGHTHHPVDRIEDNLRIINPGAKYNHPSFIVVDI